MKLFDDFNCRDCVKLAKELFNKGQYKRMKELLCTYRSWMFKDYKLQPKYNNTLEDSESI